MAKVVALVDDVFFQAKMLETARQVGVELETYSTGDAFLAAARQACHQHHAEAAIVHAANAPTSCAT